MKVNEIIRCESVAFGYKKCCMVLQNISFSLNSAEFVSLIGPNGAGKSTLLKLLQGRLQPNSGEVSILGEPVHAVTAGRRAAMLGVVEQALPRAKMRVRDYVLLGAVAQFGKPRFWFTANEKHRADMLLEQMGIVGIGAAGLHEISGGEQQLAQICRALMPSPKILLLDEPVSHLDFHHIELVVRHLKTIQKEQCVTIFASLHDIVLAQSCSDRIFLLGAGGDFFDESMSLTLGRDIVSTVFQTAFHEVPVAESSGKILIPRYQYE